jgi:branched-chain amino acid transport system permease protein
MRARLPEPARVALLAVAVVGVQLAVQAAGKGFYLTQLTMTGYYALVVVGLSLLMGYAGQISLGQAGFFAIGGYTAAFLSTLDLSGAKGSAAVALLGKVGLVVSRTDLYGGTVVGLHPWVGLVAGVALAAVVAWGVGVPVLRLRGHYLAMATLAFGTIVSAVVVGTQRLGAADGITGVPPFPILPGVRIGGGAANRVENYLLAWGLVALAMLLLGNLVRSRTGRALRAIHGAEDAARAMGVDAARLKVRVFVLAAAMAAAAGALLTHYVGGIGPSEASVMKSVRSVAMVAVGGMGSLWGALAAASVLEFLSLRGVFGAHDDAVFGGILLAVMLFAPDGILQVRAGGLLARLRRRGPGAGEEGA